MADPIKVLLVDDDRAFSTLTQEYLEMKGLVTSLAHNADDGLRAFRKGSFDICVLDVKMPFKDGFELAAAIRQYDPSVPLIFLTGETEKESRIRGFHLGADDYVTKPFSMEELFLRIRAIMKRVAAQEARQQAASTYEIGAYRFQPHIRELALGEEVRRLTAIEAKLLHLFCEKDFGAIDREVALRSIWGDDDYLRGRSLNVYVSKLRTLPSRDPHIEILNVHGVGYRLVVNKDKKV